MQVPMEHTSQTIISRRYVTQNGRSGWWTGKKVIFLAVAVLLGIVIAGKIAMMVKEYQVAQEAEQRRQLYNKILDAASVKPTEIQIDYSHADSDGSPLIFGGTHTPLSNHQEAWDQMSEAGVTMIRRDFFMDLILPYNMTLDDYVKNKNNIQDPANWNQGPINDLKRRYQRAHNLGMKTMGIVDYAPHWLTESNTPFGVIKNWTVYEDIVKKTYAMFRDDLDYLEIWNEPTYDHFNDVKDTGISMEDNYNNILLHSIHAIREVDTEKNDGRKVPLGGLVADNPKFGGNMLRSILKQSEIRNALGFISYHSYSYPEPSSTNYRTIMNEFGLSDMPIFLTEWNYSFDERIPNPNKIGDPAILYTANKFFSFFKQNLAGANYFMLEPVGYDIPGVGVKYMGYYKWVNNHAELLPQAKSWRLLSKDMGLGRGTSKIYSPTTEDTELNTLGFLNIEKAAGIAIINASPSAKMVDMRFTNLPIRQYATIQVYYASGSNDAKTAVYEGTLKVTDGATRFDFYLPKETVMGVKLSQEREWFNVLGF